MMRLGKDITGMAHLVRTLVLTHQVPYPPLGGVEMRNWQNINALMNLGPVAILSISNPSQGNNINSHRLPGVSLWSHSYLQKSSIRPVWQKILWRLQPFKHCSTDWFYDHEIVDELNRTLERFQPTLVVLEEILMYRYLPAIKRYGCPIIFDEHNAEASLFLERQAPALGVKWIDLRWQFIKVRAIEQDFVHQADQVWVCSDEDAALLQSSYNPRSAICVVPNGIDVDKYEMIRLGTCSPAAEVEPVPWTLIFPANFRYPPNQVAAQLLIEEIFPLLQEIYPDCRLILAGKSPTSKMLTAATDNSGLLITGFVEDMFPYLAAASIMIAPLLQGGGTRLKILEAFASGLPVVTTAKGAEGIRVLDGCHLLIRNTVDAIVSGVCELWEDESLRQTVTQNAYSLVKTGYSWESAGNKIQHNISKLFGESELGKCSSVEVRSATTITDNKAHI